MICFVTGHGFSRAESGLLPSWASAPVHRAEAVILVDTCGTTKSRALIQISYRNEL